MTETIQQLKEDIAILQEKLRKLEALEKTKTPAEEAWKKYWGEYPNEYPNNPDKQLWKVFRSGFEAAYKEPEDTAWKSVALRFGEKLSDVGPCGYYEFSPDEWFEWALNECFAIKPESEQEEGIWNYDPDAKFRKQEEVKKLQEKEWTYKVTDEKGETNPYKQYLNSEKPPTLYDLIYDCWHDDVSIQDLLTRIEKWLPKEQSAASSQNVYVELTVEGFNDCLNQIKSKLR